MELGEYYIEALWNTGFTISSVAEPKRSVVVLVFKTHWYALACDAEQGEVWPSKEVNEPYLSHLCSLFLKGKLLEEEEKILPLLQFVWENEFMPTLLMEEP
ncbi:MAG: hypothetical protein DRI52_11835 [Chloroflexi bacterium]|nr:MAG: hypothetical protein DRI52_11835 [Chloroflexota bacterium]RLD98355.1 MAG: hypothetical protein DRI91_03315 [Aquificota bacterium]